MSCRQHQTFTVRKSMSIVASIESFGVSVGLSCKPNSGHVKICSDVGLNPTLKS